MFDSLIREAAERFGLGGKARSFIGLLISMIFDKGHKGFGGLAQRFQQAGLGDDFNAWVSGQAGENVLQPDQFSAVVGHDQVTGMAHKLGVPNAAITVAGATLLPKLISLLTPNGTLPVVPPAEAGQLLLDQRDRQSATAAFRQEPPAAVAAGSGMGGLKWVLLLLALAAAALLVRGCLQREAGNDTVTHSTPAPPSAPADARFGMETAGGKVSVSGQVPSEADKARLWDALLASFGAGNVEGEIRVDANTLPAGWLDKLIAALPALKADGITLGFDGDQLHIDSSGLDEAQRFALSQQLRSLFAGYDISGLWDQAAAALASLPAGFSGDQLVAALNLMNIYFDTGSASITGDSQQTLRSAAEAIKQVPAGTRIEVAGHTDNTGDAAANLALSQQRADAVAARLGELGVGSGVLSAKGYGQEKPRADNASEEGRAQNRRIEFSVLR